MAARHDPQRVPVEALDLTVDFAAGEEMLTEVSCKFRPDSVARNWPMPACAVPIGGPTAPGTRPVTVDAK